MQWAIYAHKVILTFFLVPNGWTLTNPLEMEQSFVAEATHIAVTDRFCYKIIGGEGGISILEIDFLSFEL